MIRTNIHKCICLFTISITIIISACNNLGADEYHQLVKRELAKSKRVDSLFLGINFRMTSKAFYTHCWKLNKKGIITDGNNNAMVLYKIDSELKYPASMEFYPDFYENKIYHMRVTFQYDAWAPWNKAQSADSLLPRILSLLKEWYPESNGFVKISDKVKGIVFVKVDGNRRILVGKYDNAQIRVDYEDLLVKRDNK